MCALLFTCCTDTSAKRVLASPQAIDLKQAVSLAIDALGKQPKQWTQGCNVRVRPGTDDWAIYFEPIPMGPGFDVMVVIHKDGSATVTPGY